ncbi:MAG: DEAD/DEAH box helicase [Cyclobacteriaceae bacterium]|nr:DEAD/DEAH box helicase [Cyclobacteriaceae bacterium]
MKPVSSKSKTRSKSKINKKKPVVSYHKRPEELSLDQWQAALRRQFAANNTFEIRNIGTHPVYSDFSVHNPATQNTYKVAIRSNEKQIQQGHNYNFCECYDFKTNGLGTCKHIEAVWLHLYKKRGIKTLLKETYNPPYSSLYLQYTSDGRKVRLRIGSDDKAQMEALAAPFFIEGTLLESAFDNIDEFLSVAKKINPDFRCYEDALTYILEVRSRNQRKKWLEKHAEKLQNGMLRSFVEADLHPYQKEGVQFGILSGKSLIADEMGLGKTLQAITIAEVLKNEFGLESVLIVCPTSLKYQWKSEIEKFTQSSAHVIEGGHLQRIPQYSNPEYFYKIVSHHTVGYDLKQINQSEPGLIILDEAQRIKNWKTKISQNIKKLQSEYSIVLTGTPLENKLEELYSIVQFIDPFKLGALYRFLHEHQIYEPETGKVIGYKNLNAVGALLSDILIRRTKKEVMSQLPDRQDKNLFVPMTKEQSLVHQEAYDIVSRLVFKWRRMGFLNEKDRQRLLINLNMMRMVCDSTFIIDQKTRHDTKIDELMSLLDEIFSMEGEKVVIFSQWERMTRLVAQELDALGIKYENLHGGVPAKDRKELLDSFLHDPESRVFLSTDAGGVGLNLQSAAWLINLDIPWNPAVLEQRIARIYRMGQKKKVNIVNLVATGTIEHKMLDVLKFKSSMAAGVLDDGEDAIMMKDDKFKEFMNQMAEVVDEKPDQLEGHIASEEDIRDENSAEAVVPVTNQLQEGHQLNLFDDDIVETEKPITKSSKSVAAAPSSDQSGIDVLQQFAALLKNPATIDSLVTNLTEKDEKNGKTYMKIPVDNEDDIKGLLTGLGKLLSKLNV